MTFDEALVDRPATGRTFSAERRVRLGEVGPDGRLRLDALARHLQDVSNDDVVEAGLEGAMAWVVRRTRIDVERLPVFREDLCLTTWCSATGSRWAARRVDVDGARGGRARAEALWVHVDLDRGTPLRLPEDFHRLFGGAAGGRTVRARLEHEQAPEETDERVLFPLRASDLDLMGHVNNAISWAMVEEVLARRGTPRTARLLVEVEHRGAIDPGAAVELLVADRPGGFALWADTGDGVATTAVLRSARD